MKIELGALAPHQLRVLAEYAELEIKRLALQEFLRKSQPAFVSDTEWARLTQQSIVMGQYANILSDRIEQL